MKNIAVKLNEQVIWNDLKTKLSGIKKNNHKMQNTEFISYARFFCFSMLKELWSYKDITRKWPCRELQSNISEVLTIDHDIAKTAASYLSMLDIEDCCNKAGNIYAFLLPDSYRAEHGIYYTPSDIVRRLIDIMSADRERWLSSTILDPACGGGAFIVPICLKTLEILDSRKWSSEEKLSYLENHVKGYELDEFAGWMTQVLLDIALYQLTIQAGRRLLNIITVCDTIKTALTETSKYDIIIGNPPYNRVKLASDLRLAYKRSLYGHANLYGLFIDAALRLKKTDAYIGFVTPTSFLGGLYYSNLRKLLSESAPLSEIDFVAARAGVFDEVLQETCLAVFGPNPQMIVKARKLYIDTNECRLDYIADVSITKGSSPWIIPRDKNEVGAINSFKKEMTTLFDYGYNVITGPLVWNRMKPSLRKDKVFGAYPIIWAEAISTNGEFSFNYNNRSLHYICLDESQKKYLLLDQSAVILQRTTAKEQTRRLVSTVIPDNFIQEYNGVVVENHVNILKSNGNAVISPETLAHILNTKAVDSMFRCISGSVAVSATELKALPLPPVRIAKKVEELITQQLDKRNILNKIENLISEFYNMEA